MRGLVVAAALVLAGRVVPAQVDTSERVLGYRLPGMAEARVLARTYRTVSVQATPRRLTMDVYRPGGAGAAERRPALVFVHGGLVAGESGQPPTEWPGYRAWGRLAAAAGFAAVTFNHRLTTDENLEEAAGDVEAAIAYVRANAAELGVDPDRLCVAVYSAGGPLASLFLRERRPYVRCLVLFYPFLDLEHMRAESRFRAAHPAARVDSLIPRYAPAHLVRVARDGTPPIFLAMAGEDQIPGLNGSIQRFMSAALESRTTIDFVLHRAGGHGFDVRNHDARTAAILESVLAFVRRHLGP